MHNEMRFLAVVVADEDVLAPDVDISGRERHYLPNLRAQFEREAVEVFERFAGMVEKVRGFGAAGGVLARANRSAWTVPWGYGTFVRFHRQQRVLSTL